MTHSIQPEHNQAWGQLDSNVMHYNYITFEFACITIHYNYFIFWKVRHYITLENVMHYRAYNRGLQ